MAFKKPQERLIKYHFSITKSFHYLLSQLLSTPLHVATRVGFAECVNYLVECGARINQEDSNGDSPIHEAVRLGHVRVVKSLIVHGADLFTKNKV